MAGGVPGWSSIACDVEKVRADDLIILSGLSFQISKIVLHKNIGVSKPIS